MRSLADRVSAFVSWISGNGRVNPDLSRIVPYTPSDDQRVKGTTIRRYSNGAKELLYINASHVTGTNNPTCDMIREAVERYTPDRIVVESKSGTPVPPNSEIEFAESMAHQNDISIVRGEPDDDALFQGAKAKGYSAKDVMALYLLRMIAQDRQDGKLMDETHVAERASYYLSNNPAFAHIPASERLGYAEFKEKYFAKVNRRAFADVGVEDVAPYTSTDASYFQKLSASVAYVREEILDTTIAGALNQRGVNRVLVVYGGAHRTMSEPVWEAALGKGKDIASERQTEDSFTYRSDWSQQPRNRQGYRAVIARNAQLP